MNKKIVLVLVNLAIAVVCINSASATANFYLDPQDGSSSIGTDVVVNLNFTTDAGFKSCNADLTIDSTIVNITSGNTTEPGTSPIFTMESWGYAPGGAPNRYKIAFADLTGGGAPAGTYCLAKLTFSPVAAGVSNLNFTGLAATDQSGVPDTVTATNGTFTVTGVAATTGDININEIMYDPAGDESWYEWIELHNNDTKEIDVSGWVLNGTIGGSDTILSGAMGMDGYLIIAKNVSAFQERYPAATCSIIKGNWTNLANGGDWVNLSNATSASIHTVNYPGGFSDNYSAELNATGGWEESLVEGGTPCQLNSVLAVDEIAPEIFNLQPADGSFINDTTPTISANYSDPGSGINESSVEIVVDGTDVTLDPTNTTVTASGVSYIADLNEGLHTVTVNVSDNADDPNTNSTSWSFTVDITKPTIEFVEPPTPVNNTEVTVNYVNVTVNVTDNFDLTQAVGLLWWNETETEPMTKTLYAADKGKFNYTMTDLANGEYTYKVYANDTAGNMNESETRVVTVNVTALPWDLNNNGQVDVGDLVIVGNHFGETGSPGWVQYDFNNNGQIDVGDLVIVGNHFGETI